MQEEVPDFFSEVSMNGQIKVQSFQDFLESSTSSNYVKFKNLVMNLQRCCKTLQKDITSSVLAHFIKQFHYNDGILDNFHMNIEKISTFRSMYKGGS